MVRRVMRFNSVQALRGIACLLVVAYHAAPFEARYGLGFSPLQPVSWFGFAGVDLFFVISGFIIATTSRPDLGRPGRAPGFVFRRAWRIYPLYWLALLLAAGHWVAFNPDPLPFGEWDRELAGTWLLLPQASLPTLMPIAWTLTFELMFYSVFAMLLLAPRGAAAPVLATWAAAVCVTAAMGYRSGGPWLTCLLSPFVLEFLAGCLVAWRPVSLTRSESRAAIGGAIAWAGIGIVLTNGANPHAVSDNTPLRVTIFGPTALLLVFAVVGRERSLPWNCPRIVRELGDASYSIYVSHVTVLQLVQYASLLVRFPHERPAHAVWVAAMIAAPLGFGVLLHRGVESRLLKLWKRRRSETRDGDTPALRRAA